MNFQKQLDELIKKVDPKLNGQPPLKLLLHSCCAPCSSYVLEYLSEYFEITVLYYNPNITEEKEYRIRAQEQKRLIDAMHTKYSMDYVELNYEPEEFFRVVKGYEKDKEGGQRCINCFGLRLRTAAEFARKGDYDLFGTTLTISPMKNAEVINEIGEMLADEIGISWLPSDFKKKNGYKRSIELSQEFGLYRQDYCGCGYSKAQKVEDQIRKEQKSNEKDN